MENLREIAEDIIKKCKMEHGDNSTHVKQKLYNTSDVIMLRKFKEFASDDEAITAAAIYLYRAEIKLRAHDYFGVDMDKVPDYASDIRLLGLYLSGPQQAIVKRRAEVMLKEEKKVWQKKRENPIGGMVKPNIK